MRIEVGWLTHLEVIALLNPYPLLQYNILDVSSLVSANVAVDGQPRIMQALCAWRWRRKDYQSLQHDVGA